jgi:hypothetical protein
MRRDAATDAEHEGEEDWAGYQPASSAHALLLDSAAVPEQKDVISAIMGASATFAGLLLVFDGLCLGLYQTAALRAGPSFRERPYSIFAVGERLGFVRKPRLDDPGMQEFRDVETLRRTGAVGFTRRHPPPSTASPAQGRYTKLARRATPPGL